MSGKNATMGAKDATMSAKDATRSAKDATMSARDATMTRPGAPMFFSAPICVKNASIFSIQTPGVRPRASTVLW